jgi:DNA (cytosine-5)-methyltransferase 1
LIFQRRFVVDKIRFFDLFGGIGGFRLGLERVSDQFKCVGYLEKDKFAVKSYNAIFGGNHIPTNVRETEAEQFPDMDILCAGFPCQSFSVAGERGGFDDTRGTLFFEIARIARRKLPQILLLENVKGLLSHANGETFGTILQTLDELGYDAEWQVLNSKSFGVPQNRERVFIVGHLRGGPRPEVFPIGREGKGDVKAVSEDGEGVSHCIDSNYAKGISPNYLGTGRRTQILKNHRNRELRNHGLESPTINKIQGGGQCPMVLEKRTDEGVRTFEGDISGAVRSMDCGGDKRVLKGTSIRKLTPRECWRLQGFPDWAFEAAQEVNSDTQLYKQAGNAVTVNVIEVIGERLLWSLE